jgi:alkanesulfonate monooxygenase SsuD/methylene tetrahydromethanopterin reductase-like flavin-dependent oxidoreductase (luciferase family)
LIGGQGEKKTLRLMAEHAEMANFTSPFDELPRKLEVLQGHCEAVGRDIDTINKTSLCTVLIARSMEEAEALRNQFLRARGMDWDTLDDGMQALLSGRLVVGDPDAAGERVQEIVGVGLDGLTFNLPANGHDPDAVAHTVGVIKAALT